MWIAILILVLFFIAQLLGGGFALVYANIGVFCGETAFDLHHLTEPTIIETGIGTLVADAILIVGLWIHHFTSYHPLQCFRKGMPRKWGAGLFSFVALAFGLNFLLQCLNLDDMGMMAQFDAMKGNILCIALMCIVAPMAEEFTFREGILRKLLETGTSPWVAIITSAVAFGVVHIDPQQMVPAIILGVVLGLFYYKTKDLRLCLIAHMVNNSIAVVEMECPKISGFIEGLSTMTSCIAGAVLIVISSLLLLKYARQ